MTINHDIHMQGPLAPEVFLLRLDNLAALQCTENVVFIAMDTYNPHLT